MKHGIGRVLRRRTAFLAAIVLTAPAVLAIGTTNASAAVATSITINGTQSGRIFDGIGAISGGGGNSRLLIDYPEPQRSQILDYLFKPGVGANLQILKVEIGGDTNSTDGAEKSHMHTRTDLNCDRGYEWWLMEQAKARNPAIKLASLAWGAPGWVGSTFWTDDTINYLVKWLDCAKSRNLTMDYIGGWNEKGFDKAWFIRFNNALATSHPNVKIVADDGNKGWLVADAMAEDAAFARAIDVLGIHYSCGYTQQTAGRSCPNSTNARNQNKPLWASETGSQDYNTGVFAAARTYNRGYIDARMTGYHNWNLIAALTPNLRFATVGLLLANQPWSGAYSVGKMTWAMAHTTQFTAPGWRYIDAASGYLGGDRVNGSFVTMKSPNGQDYTTVYETVDATETNTVSVNVTGGLSTGAVRVYATRLASNNTADHFARQADVTPSNGRYTLTLQPGFLYTVSTTTGQGKGTARGPAGHALALPYTDNFDSYPVGKEARYLADMDGAFETANCAGGRTGRCVRQMVPQAPILWRTGGQRDPHALIGDVSWRDYTFAVDGLMERAGWIQIQGRVGTQGRTPKQVNAYFLRVTNAGAWSIIKSDTTPTLTTLASGTTTAPGINTWHRYSLTFAGSRITARLDNTVIGAVTDTSYAAGQVGIANSQWIHTHWDNLAITGGGGTPGPDLSGTYRILNEQSGHALSVVGASTANLALIEQAVADPGAAHQQWRVVAAGGGYKLINVASGRALDVPRSSTVAGTQLIQYADNGGVNQQWDIVAAAGSYTITSRLNGLRVDVQGNSTAAGAAIIQWTATNGANQRWRLVKLS